MSGLKEPIRVAFHERATPDQFRRWLKELEFAQNEVEFEQLLNEVRGIGSLLEIGSRFGESLYRFSEVMRPHSRLVSVDLPDGDETMTFLDSETALRNKANQMAVKGHECIVIIENSHKKEVVDKCRELGPYDFIFIDGDHSEGGVWSDWENYGPMGKIIGFHDIHPDSQMPCRNIWPKLKAEYEHKEFLDSGWMGIGLIYRE